MASKAAKKRAKIAQRGRPKKENVVRYENGRIDKGATENLAQTRATVIEARQRHYGRDIAIDDPRYGYSLGRMCLRFVSGGGNCTDDWAAALLDAGNRMHADFERYYATTGIPSPSPRAQDLTRVRGLADIDRQDAARKASNRIMGIEGALALVDEQGKPVMQLTKRVVLRDEDTRDWTPWMLARVKRGLRQLVDFYGIGEGLTSTEDRLISA